MNILYLTFYFEPDIGPGSFRNTALVRELARQLGSDDTIHVITTQPNRYQSYKPDAPDHETWQADGCPVHIERIRIPPHKSGQLDQIRSFWRYFRAARRLTRERHYTLVVASSSRLFTAFLGAVLARRGRHFGGLARKQGIPLFLDIRDLFREAILDTHKNPLIHLALNPFLRAVERYTFGYARHINLVSEGFNAYFSAFPQATYSYFTNGIDEHFLTIPRSSGVSASRCKTILYAGNIGEGQGLHKIVPQAARQLGNAFRFVIFGNGSAKYELEAAIRVANCRNVELHEPVNQTELIAHYQKADYLFVHLNDLAAFSRVLPSKLFEYGATDKPIIAGVSGYAAGFVREHLTNYILFAPGNVIELVRQVQTTPYYTAMRTDFRTQFQRQVICQAMARQVLKTLADTMRVNG